MLELVDPGRDGWLLVVVLSLVPLVVGRATGVVRGFKTDSHAGYARD